MCIYVVYTIQSPTHSHNIQMERRRSRKRRGNEVGEIGMNGDIDRVAERKTEEK